MYRKKLFESGPVVLTWMRNTDIILEGKSEEKTPLWRTVCREEGILI
jgi:hypothetical protein